MLKLINQISGPIVIAEMTDGNKRKEDLPTVSGKKKIHYGVNQL